MLSRVDSAYGGRTQPVRVAHAKGVGEALSAVADSHLLAAGESALDGTDGARVDDALGHAARGRAGARDLEVIKVESKLRGERERK